MATNLFDLYAKISLDDSEFNRGLDAASSKFGAFGQAVTGISSVGKKAFKAVGVAATAGSVALGAFMKSSVDTGMTFDKSMSQVAATMGLSVDEINQSGSEANKTFQSLRDAAIQYGETTAFTSTQASEALNYMALAGYDAETAIKTLPAVLNLAAAGGLELGYASDMITDSQTALGLSLEETNVLMDQMAMTASKSNTSVGQLGEAILTVGGTAQYMSGGTTELNSVLGVLADNGIKGSEAGTHLRNMLLSLAAPTDKAQAWIDQLGVKFFDAEGNMRSFSDIFPELNAAMADLTQEQKLQAFSDIFNVRDIASANALLGTSADRWEELGEYIENAGGSMEQMASTQLDNLAGDVTILNSAMDGLKIAISDKVTPALRRFAKQGTDYIGRVKKALTDRGWKGALTEISSILSEMLSAFIEYLPQVASVATDMIIAFIDSISANAGSMIVAGRSMLESLLSGFAQIRERIKPLISEFIPMIVEYFLSFKGEMFGIGLDIISSIITGISQNIGSLAQTASNIMNSMANSLMTALPSLAMAGLHTVMTLAESILTNIPNLLVIGAQMIQQIVNDISAYLPGLLFVGSQVLSEFVTGIINNLPTLLDTALQIINTIVTDLGMYIPTLLQQGANLLVMLIQGIAENLPTIMATALEIIQTIITDITAYAPMLIGAGYLVFSALIKELPGILSSAATQVIAMIDNLGNQLAEKYPALAGVFENLETIIAGVVTAIGTFKAAMLIKSVIDGAITAVQGFGTALATVFSVLAANPVGAAIAAIAALVGILTTLWNKNDAFREFIINTWNTIKEKATEIWEGISTTISEKWESIKNFVSNAVNNVKDTLSGVWTTITTTVTSIWSEIWSTITGKWENIKSSVSNAINNVKEKVSTVFSNLKTNVTNTWNNIKSAITTPIENAKNAVKNAIDKIKGFFDFEWSLPKIKLPHFSITGSFSLSPPSIPHFSVSWYKKAMDNAMILNGATIFGFSGDNLLGGGEAGAEVVSGADTLMNMIRTAVGENSASNIGPIYINIDGAQYDDADSLAETIAEKLQNIVDRRTAAWA